MSAQTKQLKKVSDFTAKEVRQLANRYVSSKITLEELAYWTGCTEPVLSNLFFKSIADAILDSTTSELIVQRITKVHHSPSIQRKLLIRWEKALFARDVSVKINRLQYFLILLKKTPSITEDDKKTKKEALLIELEKLQSEKKEILGGTTTWARKRSS